MAIPVLYRYYNKLLLMILSIGCIVSLALLIVPIAIASSISDATTGQTTATTNATFGVLPSIGLILLFAEVVIVMVYDWRGTITIRGGMKSQTMSKGKMVSTAPGCFLLYLFFPEFMLPIYLIRTALDLHKTKDQRRLAMQHQIATMEAQLGIIPPTNGTCRACNKPLQIGADYCQNCGAAVVEQPKVCPVCATTTLPDAQWCPKCRTKLS